MPVEHHREPMPLSIRMAAWARRMSSLVAMRSAVGCGRGQVRPDGCGMVLHGTRIHRSFLEYDRCTTSARGHAEKWAVCHDDREGCAYEPDCGAFATILVVTTDSTIEERIVRSARSASVGRPVPLPVLLTCERRITRDPSNSHGLLGRIWRCPEDPARRGWPATP